MMAESVVTNLWPYSLQVGLLVAAMGIVLALLRVPSPRARLVAWRVVLGAALLLPFQPWRVAHPATADAARDAEMAQLAATDLTRDGASADARHATAGTRTANRTIGTARGATTAAGGTAGTARATNRTVALTLIGGAVCRLLWLALGWHILHRRLRHHTPLAVYDEASVWQEQLQQTLGTAARVEWLDDLTQPITFGIWPPVVLLPGRLAALPVDVQRAVVCHELLHVQRRDWVWVVGEEIARAVFWFHPAMWWLLDQLQAAREELVDRLTLRATGRRKPYLEALLAFAAEPAAPVSGPVAAFFRSSRLRRRIASLMREVQMSRTQRIATALGLGLSLTGALAAGIAAFPLHASAAMPQDTLIVMRAPDSKPGPLERRARKLTEGAPVPSRLVNVPFEFPPDLAEYATTALVSIRVVLDAAGTVAESRVESYKYEPAAGGGSSPETMREQMTRLGERTLQIVRQWQYEAIADAPLAMTLSIYYSVRGPSPRGSIVPDAASPRVIERIEVPAEGEAIGGVPSGVRGGVPGGVPDGASSGVAGGVTGGVPGGVPGNTRRRAVTIPPSGPVRVGGDTDIKAPAMIYDVQPVYPPDAVADRVKGVVMLDAEIGVDGRVTDTHVLKSVPRLDQAAIDAIRQWRLEPTLVDGVAVPVVVTITVDFRLR